MAKNSLNDYSITAALNTDIAGTNIDVNCAPQDVGVYMRTQMAQLAYCVQGTAGLYPATWRVGTLNADVSNVTTANVTGTLTAGTFAAGALTPTSLAVTNNATIGGTLSVTGATSLGAATVTSLTATVGMSVTGASGLTVSNNVQINGAANVAGALGVGGTLNVSAVSVFGAGGLTVSGNEIVNGAMAINGAGTALTLSSGALVVNGSTSSGAVSGWYVAPSGQGPASFGNLASSILATGNMVSAGFFANSDARVKSDIATISPADGEEAIRLWRPVTYLKAGRHEAGFIAQEMALAGYKQYVGLTPNDAIEEYVDAQGNVFPAGFELNLNYSNCIAFLTACSQSLMNKNETLTTALQSALARIEVLEGKLA